MDLVREQVVTLVIVRFYRRIPTEKSAIDFQQPIKLVFTEEEKTFDPKAVYGNAPNPTQL
jgi:phosphoribosyl-AMP cyclohydrolase